METLNKHAPLKKRYIRANNSPFMNEDLCKAIMVRSRLRNKFLKLKTDDVWNAYRIQRNFCVSLLRDTKRNFYENLDPNTISDNNKFWKQVKPFFSDKTPTNSRFTLSEGDEFTSNTAKCAEIFNNYFSDSVIDLDVDRSLHVCYITNMIDPVERAINKYIYHPSILKITKLEFANSSFSFQHITKKHIQNIINNLDSSKAYQKDNIPPKLLKMSSDICTAVLNYDINRCIDEGRFPFKLKYADITLSLFKSNYRPVSILPTFSKIYEEVFYYQIFSVNGQVENCMS